MTCSQGICVIFDECSNYYDKLSDLQFSFDNNLMYSVPPQSYLLDGTELLGMPGSCVVGVMGMDFAINFYILGDTFLKNYYSVYSMGTDPQAVALGLSVDSLGTITKYDPGLSGGAKFAIILFVFSLIIGLGCLAYHYQKKKRLRRDLQDYTRL